MQPVEVELEDTVVDEDDVWLVDEEVVLVVVVVVVERLVDSVELVEVVTLELSVKLMPKATTTTKITTTAATVLPMPLREVARIRDDKQ